MISIASLWLPILIAAVIVFVASSVIHMAPLHGTRVTTAGIPKEAEVVECPATAWHSSRGTTSFRGPSRAEHEIARSSRKR